MLVAAPRVPQKLEGAQDTCPWKLLRNSHTCMKHWTVARMVAESTSPSSQTNAVLFRNLLVVSSSDFLFFASACR